MKRSLGLRAALIMLVVSPLAVSVSAAAAGRRAVTISDLMLVKGVAEPAFVVGGGADFDVSPDGKELVFTSNRDAQPANSTNSDL
jgi:hypothetical protein